MSDTETSMLAGRRRSTRGGMAASAPVPPDSPAPPRDQAAISTPPAPIAAPIKSPAPTAGVRRGDYQGAPSRAFGMKMLEPARTELEAAVDELKDQGVATDLTEVIHALIFTSAADVAKVHASIKKLRAARYGI